ncbi:MAG: hypothetical protein MUD00_01660 [Candidatus Pacebacteria bacterium]|jgi:hypothetical protein|nr:hypothetical protein [Candidatus Paceibacterota bacterium]
MTTDWKNKLKDWFNGSNLVLIILLAVSILANGYLLYQMKDNGKKLASQNIRTLTTQNLDGSSVATIESPYGVRNEVYSKYEDGKWKTYSTSTPITETEVKEMRATINARHKALMDYFRKQDELMNQFWSSFYGF